MKKRKDLNKAADSIVYMVLASIVAVTLLPLGWILSTAFKPGNEIFANPPYWIPHVPTLENFKTVLFESSIPEAFSNSLQIGLMTTGISLLLGGSAGYALARFKFRAKGVFSLFVLTSQMLPMTVLMIPMYYMENALGVVDTKIGVAMAHLVIALPLVTWMLKGYFQGIPKEIEEASMIDGCSFPQTMFHVVIPLLKPALAATGIYAFVSSWNEFALANVLTRSDASRTIPIALNEFSSFFQVDWGDTMAAAALISMPVILLFILVQKQFVEGLAGGAVKG